MAVPKMIAGTWCPSPSRRPLPAKSQRGVTFLNGTAAAQEVTLVDPIPNFFRFSTDGAQWTAGLGRTAHARGHKRVVTVAEDYGFPPRPGAWLHAGVLQCGAYCRSQAWGPDRHQRFQRCDRQHSRGRRCCLCRPGRQPFGQFLKQCFAAGRKLPLIAGTATLDHAVLSQAGVDPEKLLGTQSSGPVASSWISPGCARFAKAYTARYPQGFDFPSLAAYPIT